MATTDFQPFATGDGANVLSPAAYTALTSLIANGYQSGTALSVQINTTLRQAMFMSAVLANFMVAQGISQPDDGNLSAAVTNLESAITTIAGTPNVFTGGTTTGSANAQVLASLSPASGFSLSNNGQTIIATAGHTNTGAMTLAVTSPSITATAVKIMTLSGLVNTPANTVVTGGTYFFTVNTAGSCLVVTDANNLFLQAGNNLSDLTSTSTARTNLGLGTASTVATSSLLQVANNLSDVANTTTSRTNIAAAPLPISAVGIGQLIPEVGSATSFTLPTGAGTWFVFFTVNNSSGEIPSGGYIGGYYAAGATVTFPGSTTSYGGWIWRIS